MSNPGLHRPAGLSPAAGRGRRHRRRADGPAQGGPRQYRSGRRSLPARNGGAGALRRGHGTTHHAGRQRLLRPRHRRRLPQVGCPFLHHRSAAPKLAEPHLGHTGSGLDTGSLLDGAAAVAETSYTPFQSEPGAAPVRLIVRRVKPTPGSQLALFATYSYHACITDRGGDTLELELDHRRHAEIENAIRDLKYGVGLNHLPSGRFAANAAWLAIQVMAHNLARWTARIGLGEQVVTTKTLRRRFFSLAGRLTRSARRLTLHLPRHWPWEAQSMLWRGEMPSAYGRGTAQSHPPVPPSLPEAGSPPLERRSLLVRVQSQHHPLGLTRLPGLSQVHSPSNCVTPMSQDDHH